MRPFRSWRYRHAATFALGVIAMLAHAYQLALALWWLFALFVVLSAGKRYRVLSQRGPRIIPLISIEAPPTAHPGRTLPIGTVGSQAYAMDPKAVGQHILALGASGAGKTNAISVTLRAQHRHGRGAIIVEFKGDPDVVRDARAIDPKAQVFEIGGEGAWNPLRYGDAQSLSDSIMETEQWTHPHFTAAARRHLNAELNALQVLGRLTSLRDVVRYLENPEAGARLVGEARRAGHEDAARALENAINSLDKEPSLRSGIKGLGTRLAVLVESPSVRDQLIEGDGGIDLDHALVNGGIVVFSLSAPRYSNQARALGALVAGMALARAQALTLEGLQVSAQLVIDEAAELTGPQIDRAVRMGRSIGLGVMICTQELTDLQALGSIERIWASCAVKLIGRQDVPESARFISDSIGQQRVTRETEMWDTPNNFGDALSKALVRVPDRKAYREEEEPIVHPDVITRLRTGEFLVIERWPESWVGRVQIDRMPDVTRVSPPVPTLNTKEVMELNSEALPEDAWADLSIPTNELVRREAEANCITPAEMTDRALRQAKALVEPATPEPGTP